MEALSMRASLYAVMMEKQENLRALIIIDKYNSERAEYNGGE